MDGVIPASELLAIIDQLRTPIGTGQERGELGTYMRGVMQGRKQGAERLEGLLREYGIEVPGQKQDE